MGFATKAELIAMGYVETPKGWSKYPAKAARSEQESPARKDDSAAIPGDEAKLNKTERAFLAYLRMLKVPHVHIQAISLKLAHDCRLTVDFTYLDENGRCTFVDVKGFQREDALIKMKVAARTFPGFRFCIVKRNGSGWKWREVNP